MIAVSILFESSLITNTLLKIPMNRRMASTVIGGAALKSWLMPSLKTGTAKTSPTSFAPNISSYIDDPKYDLINIGRPITSKIAKTHITNFKDSFNLNNLDNIAGQAISKKGPLVTALKLGQYANKKLNSPVGEDMTRRDLLFKKVKTYFDRGDDIQNNNTLSSTTKIDNQEPPKLTRRELFTNIFKRRSE